MSASCSGPAADQEPQDPAAERPEPRTYVTVISVPYFGDGGVQRLYAPMKQAGPEPEPDPYSLSISEPGQPRPEVVPELEAPL